MTVDSILSTYDVDWRWKANISDYFQYDCSQEVLRGLLQKHPSPVRSLADIGCGDGRRTFDLLESLSRPARRLLWLDPSPAGLESVRLHGAALPAEQAHVCARLQDLQLDEAGRFDCVLSLHSLYVRLGELDDCSSRLLELVEPGGLLVVEISSTDSALHLLQRDLWQSLYRTELPVCRSAEIVRSLTGLGASAVELRTIETIRIPELGSSRRYADLPGPARAFLNWFNKGRELPEHVGDAFLDSVLRAADVDAAQLRLDSEVSIVVCRMP